MTVPMIINRTRGSAGIAARHYHDSGAYDRDLRVVAGQAESWIKARAASAHQPALVLDIDETALSNWEIIQRDDFGRPIAGPADLASAVDFKTPVRFQIEQLGYTIISNMGDQPSDLLGGHAEKKFLLPDPFYRVQ
jgi:hypothetical protein